MIEQVMIFFVLPKSEEFVYPKIAAPMITPLKQNIKHAGQEISLSL